MNKSHLTCCCIAALGCVALAAPAVEQKKLTDAEKAERRERVLRVMGGMVVKPDSQKGKIAFVNAQKKVPASALKEDIDYIRLKTRFNLVLEEGEAVTMKTAADALKAHKADFGVFLVEDDSLPTMLLAPESRWAIVNVTAIAKGANGQSFVTARVKKEVVRAYAFLCGGVSTKYKNSLLGGISKPEDLDEVTESALPMDVVVRTVEYLPWFGVTRAVQAQYLEACKQGWAPAPTNDYQKAIWKKTHEVPSAPLKLEK